MAPIWAISREALARGGLDPGGAMAARLAALRDDRIHPRGRHRARIVHRGDHGHDLDAALVAARHHVAAGIAETDAPHGHALLEDDLESFIDEIGDGGGPARLRGDPQTFPEAIERALYALHRRGGQRGGVHRRQEMGGLREMSQRATQQTEGRGLSPAYLSRIERGDTAPPRRPVLKLMADLLGVSEMRLDLIAQGWMLLEIKSVLEVQGEQRLLEKGDRIAGLGVVEHGGDKNGHVTRPPPLPPTSQGYLAALEGGLRSNPSLETLNKLAKAFHVPVTTLLE